MTKKTTLTAIHALTGKVYTRTTARTYTHMVLRRVDIPAARREREANARHMHKVNSNHYGKLAQGVHELAAKYPSQFSPERIAKEVAEAQEWMAMGVEGHVAAALAKFDALPHHVEALAAGRDFYYYDNGWCGSLALAQKKADLSDVILEVTAK